MRTLILLPLLALTLAPATGAAQTQQCPDGRPYAIDLPAADATQEITLEGGTKYLGRVLDPADPLRFELLSGDVLEIAHARLICIRVVPGTRQEGEFWPEDPNTTRLFFGPTGRALRQGEGYFSVIEIIMPFVSVGITDRFTLSGGTPLIFTSDGPQLFWFAPKLQVIRTGSFDASVGVLGFLVAGETESVGVLYSVATWGATSDAAVTAGIGWGYGTSSGIHDTPAVMLGGERRLSRSAKLITENYFFPSEGAGLLSLGPRFFGERLTADLGLAMPVGQGAEFFVFPVVNFAWNW